MQVETFACSETASEPIEACEEAIELIETLGLDGQKKLLHKPDDGPAVRNPYREMTAEERFVYGVLCPEVSKLKDYNRAPIPLRVLQIASHANSLECFHELRVWDKVEMTEKDPVLVGMASGRSSYEWDRVPFILARWGEELETFAVLLKRAVEKKRAQLVEYAQNIAANAQAQVGAMSGLSTEQLVKHGADWKPNFD